MVTFTGYNHRGVYFVADNYRKHLTRLLLVNRGRISSVGKGLDCRAGGRGFDSWDRTNTQGLKMTEKER